MLGQEAATGLMQLHVLQLGELIKCQLTWSRAPRALLGKGCQPRCYKAAVSGIDWQNGLHVCAA